MEIYQKDVIISCNIKTIRKVEDVQRYKLAELKLKFHKYLLLFQLLFRNIYSENQRTESILHLKSYIKDVGLSSFRL